MKKCRVCGVLLTDLNWYKAFKKNSNNICKICFRKQSLSRYLEKMKDPKWKAEKNVLTRKYYEKHKKYFKDYHREYMKVNGHKYRNKAKERAGKIRDTRLKCFIPLGSKCEFCGVTEKLERHHPDYDEPLIFVTCCSSCHKWIHKHPIKGNTFKLVYLYYNQLIKR